PAGPATSTRRGRTPWLLAAGALAVVAALTVVLLTRPDGSGEPQRISEYHYSFTVPDEWERSGGSQSARQVDLGPVDPAVVPDQIFVKEYELSYDADADRARAVEELRAAYEARRAEADPPTVDGFDEAATFAGRDVLYYSEVVRTGTVDWYVVFGGRYQVSIGCQHDGAGAERVRSACDHVVRTLTVRP
ncbi:MAG TPA: type VII secretion-associated protein, partial [Pseudonocardiaceae bacterium]